MCKRYQIDTYLKVNALPDNACVSVFPFNAIVSGHFLY